MERILKKWELLWERYFEIFSSLSRVKKIALAVLFAIITGISAQLYIPLPFTPVPITGQVFAVLLSGILLGKTTGTISQILYLTGGTAGINWFYGASSGIIRPTTGYLIGFVLATYITGLITEEKRTELQIIYGMLSGIAIIHLCGVVWLGCFLRIPLQRAFTIGSLPFIPFDIVKAYFAGLIGISILKGKKESI